MLRKITALVIALLMTLSFLAGCVSPTPVDVTPENGKETENTDPKTDPGTEPGTDPDDGGEDVVPEPVVPEDTVITAIACGDNVVHAPIYNQAKKAGKDGKLDFSAMYEDITDTVAAKDIAYINVETLIGGDEFGFSSYPNFNSPEDMGTFLIDAGFDVMNLAHNHMLDAPGADKAKYLRNCAKFFGDRGVTPIGYYSSLEDTENIKITEVKGVKIAWLAYTYDDNSVTDPNGDGKYETIADVEFAETLPYSRYSLNGHKAGSSPDVYIPYMKKPLIEKQVKIAKEIADVVIVSAHWGVEDSWGSVSNLFTVRPMQLYYGQFMADLGVDVIIGMHPHVIQETTWLEGKDGHKTLCAYSLGNLISGMLWGRCMVGAIFEFDIRKNGATGEITIENPYMVPTVCHYDSGFKNFKIYLYKDYTEELAKKHGCHAKDDTIAKRGMKFSMEGIAKRIEVTFSDEFLKEDFGF